MRKSQNKRLFLMAALLAGSSAIDLDDTSDDDFVGIRAGFDKAIGAQAIDAQNILTDDAYRVEIERVAIDSDELDVRPRNEDDLDRILAQLERPTIDLTPGLNDEPDETQLVVGNAHFTGRVFDETGSERLPIEGLGISGKVPLNVTVRKTGDVRQPLDVAFEVPSQFFAGIDWSA